MPERGQRFHHDSLRGLVCEMSLEYLKTKHGVDAEIGRRIRYNGREGTIVAGRGEHIAVRFDSEPGYALSLHPTLGVEYLGMAGNGDEPTVPNERGDK